MFGRLDALGHLQGFAQMGRCPLRLPGSEVNAGQGDERVEGVPVVLRGAHHSVGRFVFESGAVVVLSLFIEHPEVGVAEGNAQFVAGLGVERHRVAIVSPSRVELVAVGKDSAEVGVVDGLSHSTLQFLFALERPA